MKSCARVAVAAVLVAAAAAQERETTFEALAELTTRNACAFYRIDGAEVFG